MKWRYSKADLLAPSIIKLKRTGGCRPRLNAGPRSCSTEKDPREPDTRLAATCGFAEDRSTDKVRGGRQASHLEIDGIVMMLNVTMDMMLVALMLMTMIATRRRQRLSIVQLQPCLTRRTSRARQANAATAI